MGKTFTCHDMFHMALGQLWDCPCSGKATREDRGYSSHTEPCGNGWYNQNKIPMRMIPGLYGVIYISWFGCQHSKCREFSLDFVSLFEWCHRLHHDATESLITRENWKKTCPTFQSALRLLMILMTSSNGNIFRVTGPLCGEFIGHRWIPLTNASDAEL